MKLFPFTVYGMLMLFRMGGSHGDINIADYFKWNPPTVASTNLFCPVCCKENSPCNNLQYFATDKVSACCAIKAMPMWMFSRYKHLKGFLNITSKTGTTRLVRTEVHNNIPFYAFELHKGNFTGFPENICSFTKLVEIKLTRNQIDDITALKCLRHLDTLDLSRNRFSRIKSLYLQGLYSLRYLDLSNNEISYIQLGSFSHRPGSLMRIILSYNNLVSVDISNMILLYWFDLIDYSHNKISRITNALNWTGFRDNETMGGGTIYLHNNQLSHFPSPSEFSFTINAGYKLAFNYLLAIHNNPWFCDCHAELYMKELGKALTHWKGIEMAAITCAKPSNLKGLTLVEHFSRNKSLHHLLICNITLKDKCPPKCHCFKQPSLSRTVVNCKSSNRTKMPKILPNYNNLDIDLSNNQISILQYHPYLQRTIRVDLSHNNIHVIDPRIYKLKGLAELYLSKNEVKSLKRSVMSRDPCKWRFGEIILRCNCEMLWIKIWLHKQEVNKCFENRVLCVQGSEKKDILILMKGDICPQRSYIFIVKILGAILFIIALSTVLYINFRYEIYLLIRNQREDTISHCTNHQAEFDVYLSFNVENDDVRRWAVQDLRAYFEDKGFKFCIPFRDFTAGGIDIEQIYCKIAKCKSFLVVLSQDYYELKPNNEEWKHIWHTYTSNYSRKLIVVNFDHLKSKDVRNRQMKALLRVGYYVNFCNFRQSFLNDVESKIVMSKARTVKHKIFFYKNSNLLD